MLPTKGEGWGLPVVEAMAMTLPVIVTDYSGPAAYLTEANSYPLRYRPPHGSSAGLVEPDIGMCPYSLTLFVFDGLSFG